jgi:hypothetical protein
MPATSTAKHPHLDLTLRFTEADHRYVDSQGMEYESVTTMVKSAFLPFDAAAVASKVAASKGKTPEALQAEWKADGEAARDWGTRFHANMEATILGQPRPHPPQTPKEIASTKAGVEVCKKLMARFGKSLWPEKMVFSPFYRKAGTIDLLATKGNDVVILDWKTNETIKRENQWQSSCLWAISTMEECDFVKYSIQLSTYDRIIRREGYVPEKVSVKRFLIWMGTDGDKPEFIETPDRQHEVAEIMLEQAMVKQVLQ